MEQTTMIMLKSQTLFRIQGDIPEPDSDGMIVLEKAEVSYNDRAFRPAFNVNFHADEISTAWETDC